MLYGPNLLAVHSLRPKRSAASKFGPATLYSQDSAVLEMERSEVVSRLTTAQTTLSTVVKYDVIRKSESMQQTRRDPSPHAI